MMVTLGTDAHKRSHTIVARDDVGAEIGSVAVAADTAGSSAVGEVGSTMATAAVGDRRLPSVVASSRSRPADSR